MTSSRRWVGRCRVLDVAVSGGGGAVWGVQEVDLSTNDISAKGVRTIESVVAGLSCTVNLEDNDDDSDGSDGGSDGGESDISDISDIGNTSFTAGDGAGAGASASGSAGPSVSVVSAAPSVEKTLDVRGPRGALDAGRAEELCAPILRYVSGVVRRCFT